MDLAARIEELIQQEIAILRGMLSNLKSEQNALINKNLEGVDQIIEARLDYLEHFEKLAYKVIEYTRELAAELKIPLPPENDFTHDKAIDSLKEIVSVENIELYALLGQLEALFEEIDNQCNITNYFLQTGGLGQPDSKYGQLKPNPLNVQQLKKLQIQVMDPDKEELS
jgi:FlgN protein